MVENPLLLPEGYYRRRQKMFEAALQALQNPIGANIDALRARVRSVHPDIPADEIDRFSQNLLNNSTPEDLRIAITYCERKKPTY